MWEVPLNCTREFSQIDTPKRWQDFKIGQVNIKYFFLTYEKRIFSIPKPIYCESITEKIIEYVACFLSTNSITTILCILSILEMKNRITNDT